MSELKTLRALDESFRLIRAHRGEGREVILWGRNSSLEKVRFRLGYKPYFYALSSEVRKVIDRRILEVVPAGESCFGDRISSIVVDNPSDVPGLREQFSRTWEADVPYARRFLIDKGILSGFSWIDGELIPCYPPDTQQQVYTYYLDIEVYSHTRMPNPETDPVTCLTLGNEEAGYASLLLDDMDIATSAEELWTIVHLSSEKELISLFLSLAQLGDTIVGWNLPWDLEYLEKRAKVLGTPWNLDSVCAFDLLTVFRVLYRRKSYRLKDIALEDGLTSEDEQQIDYGETWEKDKPALLSRNRRHCQWVEALNKKHRIMEYYTEIRDMVGLEDLRDITHVSTLIDTMLLRRAFAPLPTKQKHEAGTYEGALVLKPPSEMIPSVAVFDLSRFYPNVLLNEHLDPMIVFSYLQSHPVLNWGDYRAFSQVYRGRILILDLVRELMVERDRLQSTGHLEKLAALKALLNSTYGVLAYPGFRLYMREIPERVTEVARQVISALAERVRIWGYRVCYLDTDSLFIHLPTKDELPIVETRLNKALLEFGTYGIKLEHYCPSILFTGAKKRYCYTSENSDEIHFVGFEHVRTDSSNYTRRVQEEVARLILTGKSGEVIPYLRDIIQGVKSVPLEDIAISKSLKRELDQYKVPQDYMLAAQALGLHAGESVKVIPAANYPYGIAVFQDGDNLPQPPQVDWEAIIEKQVKAKVEDFLSLIHRSWSEVTGQARLL